MKSSNSANGARKLVIKPFKVQPKLPDNFDEQTWISLRHAIHAVYTKNASTMSKEELYRAVENLCLLKQSAKLYDSLREELTSFITQKVISLTSFIKDTSVVFLLQLDLIWKDHIDQLLTIRNIFLHLDSTFTTKNNANNHQNNANFTSNTAIPSIWDLGNRLFRVQLDQNTELQHRMIAALLEIIDSLRQGQHNEATQVIGRITHCLQTLDLYSMHFEPAFLSSSQHFFTLEGLYLINNLDSSQFLAHVDKRLSEANDLSTKYFEITTKRALFDVIEQYLLKPHVTVLMERGFKQLIDENRKEDLKRMFLLFERVNSLDCLRSGWIFYIRMIGESLIHNLQEQKSFVEDVLLFQEKLDMILKYSFFHAEAFKTSLKSSFEHFLNINQKGIAEQLARFADRKLRGEKGNNEMDLENKLDQVMIIFKYLLEKDIFEAFYKKHLSKRLLMNKSASYELEKAMLTKLKQECGSSFTSKLEGMFTDVELSRQCQSSFSQYLEQTTSSNNNVILPSENESNIVSSSSTRSLAPTTPNTNNNSNIVMNIQVLTTGYWPTVPVLPSLRLPSEILALTYQFEQFYMNKFQGRKLSWAHSLERCVMMARFPRGRKELDVTLTQAVILRCFNGLNAEKQSFKALVEATGIDVAELKLLLQSLACGMIGTRVLTKEPKGKEVDDTDSFVFNTDFTNKLFHIKINTIQAKETPEEIEKTHQEVARDREYQIDAAVVRIMKSRKRLSHTMLISEVMTQLRFPAQNADIKRRIESLIERGYVERDPDENSFYRYLA